MGLVCTPRDGGPRVLGSVGDRSPSALGRVQARGHCKPRVVIGARRHRNSTRGPQLLHGVAQAATKQLDAVSFAPQELSNLAWALATSGVVCDVGFLRAAAHQATESTEGGLARFKTQELCNFVWAFAKLRSEGPLFLAKAAREVSSRVGMFKAQELANVSWAFARLAAGAGPTPNVLLTLAAEATARVREFNLHELANVSWAFATAPCLDVALFGAVSAQAAEKMSTHTPTPQTCPTLSGPSPLRVPSERTRW